jgi:hypothetical protein
MRVVKRLLGFLTLVLGSVGVLACLAGFAGTWVIRDRVDRMISNVADHVDVALSKLEERAGQANDRIDSVRDSSRTLNERVQQRAATLRGVSTEEAPDIDEIERELYARIQLGRDWMGFVQTGVHLVEQFLQMLDSISLFAQPESKTRAEFVVTTRKGQHEFEEAFRLADEMRSHLQDIRARRNLDENAARIQTLSSRINTSLENIERFGAELEAGIAQTRTDVADLKSRIRRQALVVAVIVNLLLVWLAAAQASLAIHGWRLMRS